MIVEALTFDDVLIKPCASSVLPNQTELTTNITSAIKLNIPIISSAMDTVTEANLAIAMAQVGGMGKVSRVVLDESRTYNRQSENLEKLSFEQSSETGSVRIEGKRDPAGVLKLVVNAGSAITSKDVTTTESLSDAVALRKMAREGTVGKKVTVSQFDPSGMKTMKVEHTLVASEKKIFGGVEVPFSQIETNFSNMI